MTKPDEKPTVASPIKPVVMLHCEWINPDIDSLDQPSDFEIGRAYKLELKKKIRHTDKYKALLTSEFGEIPVHSNMINDFDELIKNHKFTLAT